MRSCWKWKIYPDSRGKQQNSYIIKIWTLIENWKTLIRSWKYVAKPYSRILEIWARTQIEKTNRKRINWFAMTKQSKRFWNLNS